jgi:DNA-binding SARP family transcriptional activator/tetratricopeptide (TPR) repeat protein
MLRARLFGSLAVEVDRRLAPEIAGLRPRALLAWLLFEPGPHARAHVAARFWPDVLDTSARASLRNALSTVRVALDAVDGVRYLEANRVSVGIARTLPRSIDVERFHQLLRADDDESLERAFALAEDPLLSDLADDWVLEARDEYRDQAAEVALRLADRAEARGDLAGAVLWSRRALSHARLREAVHRALMRRLVATGERAEALAAYSRLAALLAAEFGTPPSAETRALADELRTRRTAERPRAPALTARDDSPLLGRDGEMAILTRAWERASATPGGVVIVTGAPGVGKSRIVAELADLARRAGARHAAGAGLALDGAPPLAPWSDALHELVADVPAPEPDATWPEDLARLCRGVETIWGRRSASASAEPEFERMRLFEATAAALAWCARDRPLLVVLEDLHLMDAASVALLAAVGRRLRGLGVLLVATSRPGDARIALAADALRRANAAAVELELEPLPDAAIAGIVDRLAPGLSAAVRRRAVEAAAGVPLLAREAARAAATGGDPAHGLARWVRAPRARLSLAARLLVDLAAAAGRALEPGEASRLVGPERLPDALEEACRAHLLDASEDRRIGFQHALVREACYADLAPARRAWLHGDLADVLRSRSRRAIAEIARHLLLARRGEEATGYLAAAAADARRLGALDEAAGFLREATAVARGDELEAELWLLLAEAESWRNDRDACEAAIGHAVGLLEHAGDPAGLAAAHLAHGRCLRTTLCAPREALAAYGRAIEIVERRDVDAPELRALALAGAAWAEAVSGDVERAHALIATVEDLPEARDDPALAGELELDRAAALMRAGRFAESEAPSRRAAALALEAGRPELCHIAFVNAASAAAARGDPGRALELADQVVRIQGGGARLDAERVATRGYALSRLGRHVEARQAAHELVALAASSEDPAQECVSAFDAGSIALAAGDAPEAAERLSTALEEGARRGVPRALARLRLAEARLAAGDVAAAERELRRVPFEPVGPADFPDSLVPRLRRVQGLLAAAAGATEDALRRLGESEAGWRRLHEAAPSGDAFAAAFVDLGRPPMAGLTEPGVELGRVRADQALLLSQAGRVREASQAVLEAQRLADELSFDGYRSTLMRAASASAV